MAHLKETYNASGHEVIIQQVNEGGPIRTWIDGWAGHVHDAMDEIPIEVDQSDELKAIKRTLACMVELDVLYCPNCGRLYNSDNANSTGFAGHQCQQCANEAATCDENPHGDSHDDECLNPRQKHNARVPTKYKCKHCGRVRKTTPTG